MTEQERELDLLVAELEHENRLLRARNERMEREMAEAERDTALLRQALEALESLFSWQVDPDRGQRCSNAITALRGRLGEQA